MLKNDKYFFEEDIKKIIEFQKGRNWKQFHSSKNLAISLAVEASEIKRSFNEQRIMTY